MKKLDTYLRNVRFSVTEKFIRKGDAVLDIGSYGAQLFEALGSLIAEGVGIDATLTTPLIRNNYKVLPGHFPDACPQGAKYDVITLLGVLQNFPVRTQQELAK